MEVDYKKLVRERILARDGLIRATFSGGQKGSSLAWNKVIVRPVEIKGEIHLQFSYFDDKKDITKNHLADAASKVDELLALPFRNIFVESADGNVQVNISKRGKAVVSEPKSSKTHVETNLAHDRQKSRLLSADNAEPFLKAVGIMTSDGRIRADMQRKFKQINEFLRLVDETDSFRPGSTQAFQTLSSEPIHVVDFGCGNAYLTFAIYYYLNEILKFDARVTGVDVKADLIASHQQKAESLGWSRINFHVGEIEGYIPEHKPNVVLALHACDTATDDAILKGISAGASLIVVAPCCHKQIRREMESGKKQNELEILTRHGIFMERQAEMVTDSLRALILEYFGYSVKVFEFVGGEHTPKNVMIAATKSGKARNPEILKKIRETKEFFGISSHYLEKLTKI